jgi:hypothetical protein
MIVAQNWLVECREDGVVLVRVPSTGTFGIELPDAVFSFRAGDPQYDYWQRQLVTREQPRRDEARADGN